MFIVFEIPGLFPTLFPPSVDFHPTRICYVLFHPTRICYVLLLARCRSLVKGLLLKSPREEAPTYISLRWQLALMTQKLLIAMMCVGALADVATAATFQ